MTKTEDTICCHYCGTKHSDRSTMTEREIVRRDNGTLYGMRIDRLWFCGDKDKRCGGNYQMGCEG